MEPHTENNLPIAIEKLVDNIVQVVWPIIDNVPRRRWVSTLWKATFVETTAESFQDFYGEFFGQMTLNEFVDSLKQMLFDELFTIPVDSETREELTVVVQNCIKAMRQKKT